MGAIGLATSREDTDETWGGHLVAIVEHKWLVDVTLDLLGASEPLLQLAPLITDSGSDLVTRGRTIVDLGTASITYERDDANQRFAQVPAYRSREKRLERLFYVLGVIRDDKSSDASCLIRDRVAYVAEYSRDAVEEAE